MSKEKSSKNKLPTAQDSSGSKDGSEHRAHKDDASNDAKTRGYWSDEAKRSVTDGRVTLAGGGALDYEAIAGELCHYDDDGQVDGKFFHVAYFKKGAAAADRPITFAFNGGPGSSAMWLHIGFMGPKRLTDCDVDDKWQGPVFNLTDNPHTTLAHSDLVFIDPIGTGFSRSPTEKKEQLFYDSKKDIESIGRFVEHFLIKHNRWQSPIALCGESYGGYRGAGLCAYLQEQLGIFPKAVLFVAPAIDFTGLYQSQGSVMSFVAHLPTYATTAFYHGKLDATMGATAKEVHDKACAFAKGEYLSALVAGYELEGREAMAAKLSSYTGISAEVWLHHNLRLDIAAFCTELNKSAKEYIGRLDSRYLGTVDYWQTMDKGYLDPSAIELNKRYVPAINSYLRDDLGVDISYRYETLSAVANSKWTFHDKGQTPNMNPDFVRSMQLNRDLNIYVGTGLYDLAVPPESAEFAIKQLDLSAHAISRIHFEQFPAGHMSYINEDCVPKMAAFFHRAFSPEG